MQTDGLMKVAYRKAWIDIVIKRGEKENEEIICIVISIYDDF